MGGINTAISAIVELKIQLHYDRVEKDLRQEAMGGRSRREEALAEEARRQKQMEALEFFLQNVEVVLMLGLKP